MPITLEKDPFMERTENYIVEEPVTLDNTTGPIFKLNYGCFFGKNLVVRKVGNPNPLEPMIEFTALHIQEDAVAEAGREVLTVIRSDLVNWEGDYLISYHAFGGEYSTNAAIIQSLIDNEGGQLENVPWGTIVGKPDEYNPAAHTHIVSEDILKWNDMVDSIDRLADAVRAGGVESIDAIFNYLNIRFTGVTQEIAAALSTHNGASSAHSKGAVGLGLLDNLPTATKARLNAGANSYLSSDMLRSAVGLAFNNGIRTMAAGSVTEPVAVITDTIADLHQQPQNYAIIQAGNGSVAVTEVTSERWQFAIGVSPAVLGYTAVRRRDASSWTAWVRNDVAKLNNVPNYPAASTSTPADVAGGTTVDDKLATPAVSRAIAQAVVTDSEKQIFTIVPSFQDTDFQEIDFPEPMAGKRVRLDFTALAAVASTGEQVEVTAINSVGTPLASFVLPTWASPFVSGQPIPFSGTFTFTVPTGTNRRVRFAADYDTSTSIGSGAFTRLQAYRI